MESNKPKKIKRCPLCGKEFEGKGFLTWPIVENPHKKCCKDCYENIVRPAENDFILLLQKSE